MAIGTPSLPSIQLTVDRGGNCSRCGRDNPLGMKFCGECGAPLGAKCTRKQVSVLFADVCGFTSISERLDPEDVRDYAAKHGIAEETAAIAQGLREKAEEFRKGGGEIYRRA